MSTKMYISNSNCALFGLKALKCKNSRSGLSIAIQPRFSVWNSMEWPNLCFSSSFSTNFHSGNTLTHEPQTIFSKGNWLDASSSLNCQKAYFILKNTRVVKLRSNQRLQTQYWQGSLLISIWGFFHREWVVNFTNFAPLSTTQTE